MIRPGEMSVKFVVQVMRREDLLMAPMFVDMTTSQDCPSRAVINQHRYKERGKDSFNMLTFHN